MIEYNTDTVIAALGGFPDFLPEGKPGRAYVRQILQEMLRRKTVDEGNFHLVCRLAFSRQEFDAAARQIEKRKFPQIGDKFTQTFGMHKNEVLRLEQVLLATPYARAKSGTNTQTAFDFAAHQTETAGNITELNPYRALKGQIGR